MSTQMEDVTVESTTGTRRTSGAPSGRRGDASVAVRSGGLLHAVVRTGDRRIDLLLRATLGFVMFPHGAQKLFGWFGGYGFEGTMQAFTTGMGLPWLVALAVVLIESLGAIALVLGAFGRVAAVGIAAVMLGAVVTSHLQFGFFMNWAGTQGGEGFEYHLLALALAASVIVNGSGALSLDRLLMKEAK